MGTHYKIFEKFFGTSNPFIESSQTEAAHAAEITQINKKHRQEDIVVTLQCELYEFYNGAVKEVHYARKQMLSSTTGSVVNAERMQVTVLPGYSSETELVFENRGNESYGAHPSNLVVKFAQKAYQILIKKHN